MAADGALEQPPKRRRVEHLAAVSDIVPEKAQASWELRGYLFWDKTKGKYVDSPVLLEAAGARFYLRAYLGGRVGNPTSTDGYFGLYCFRAADLTPDAPSVSGRFVITVVGEGDCKIERRTIHTHLWPGGTIYGNGWHDFGQIADLKKPLYLVDDTLVIRLEMTAWGSSQQREWTLPAAPGSVGCVVAGGASDRTRAALVEDLAALLTGGQATDVEVSGTPSEAGQQVVKAHRLVLAARSPVLNRMLLESSMRESQAGAKVCLEGADHAVVAEFVRFLYTGELSPESLDDSNALCHLLSLGHRFEVHSLVQLCTARLTIAEDTAIDQLIMAEQFGLSELKEKVIDFVLSSRPRLAQIQKTKAFARMTTSYPQLLGELFARSTQTA